MKLTFEQIKSAASGATSVFEDVCGVCFRRFTPPQAAAVLANRPETILTVQSCPGVKLMFRTDSATLGLSVEIFPRPQNRHFFAVDVCADGKFVGSLDNFSDQTIPDDYGDSFRPQETRREGTLSLGAGEKLVSVYLPWSMPFCLYALELDDGASFAPAVPEKHAIFYGDSITQGFDALHPRLTLASRIADAFGVQQNNKAIAGDGVLATLAVPRDDFDPEFVFIAYGANDWWRHTREQFHDEYRAFLGSVTKNYPGVPVFSLAPLTRGDSDDMRLMGPFHTMRDVISLVAAEFRDVTVIDCSDFFPADPLLYSDGRLHPNDRGFELYFNKLFPRLSAVMDARHG